MPTSPSSWITLVLALALKPVAPKTGDPDGLSFVKHPVGFFDSVLPMDPEREDSAPPIPLAPPDAAGEAAPQDEAGEPPAVAEDAAGAVPPAPVPEDLRYSTNVKYNRGSIGCLSYLKAYLPFMAASEVMKYRETLIAKVLKQNRTALHAQVSKDTEKYSEGLATFEADLDSVLQGFLDTRDAAREAEQQRIAFLLDDARVKKALEESDDAERLAARAFVYAFPDSDVGEVAQRIELSHRIPADFVALEQELQNLRLAIEKAENPMNIQLSLKGAMGVKRSTTFQAGWLACMKQEYKMMDDLSDRIKKWKLEGAYDAESHDWLLAMLQGRVLGLQFELQKIERYLGVFDGIHGTPLSDSDHEDNLQSHAAKFRSGEAHLLVDVSPEEKQSCSSSGAAPSHQPPAKPIGIGELKLKRRGPRGPRPPSTSPPRAKAKTMPKPPTGPPPARVTGMKKCAGCGTDTSLYLTCSRCGKFFCVVKCGAKPHDCDDA